MQAFISNTAAVPPAPTPVAAPIDKFCVGAAYRLCIAEAIDFRPGLPDQAFSPHGFDHSGTRCHTGAKSQQIGIDREVNADQSCPVGDVK
jgi:hypothetical protein